LSAIAGKLGSAATGRKQREATASRLVRRKQWLL
jgi:hypothetical protein